MTDTLKVIPFDAVEWAIEVRPEMEEPADCLDYDGSDDDAQKIREDYNSGNLWAWCCVRVVGRWRGLEADDYLGCCNYASEADFRTGGYYEDMRCEVMRQLQEKASNIAEFFVEEV